MRMRGRVTYSVYLLQWFWTADTYGELNMLGTAQGIAIAYLSLTQPVRRG